MTRLSPQQLETIRGWIYSNEVTDAQHVYHNDCREAGRLLLAELDAVRKELKECRELKIFEQAFADKLKEFGTIERLIEEYSAHKLKHRDLQAQLSRAKKAL